MHNGRGSTPPGASPPREGAARPREKLQSRGCESLGDGELIALIVGSGCAGRSASRIGRGLVRRHSLDQLAGWSAERWARVGGLGAARAASLVAAFELGRRTFERTGEAVGIHGPEDVAAQVRDLRRARREHFLALLLNARNEMLRREVVSIGSLNASIVHPREVFAPAVAHSAASLILVHNHPSGDPEPSDEDLAITKRLVQAGELMGIQVLDHVIVASRGVVSFKARRLM